MYIVLCAIHLIMYIMLHTVCTALEVYGKILIERSVSHYSYSSIYRTSTNCLNCLLKKCSFRIMRGTTAGHNGKRTARRQRYRIPRLYLSETKSKSDEITELRMEETHTERLARVRSEFTPAQLLCLRMEFNHFDDDGSKTIDRNELRKIVKSMGGHHVKDSDIDSIFQKIDTDNSGDIDWMEYLSMMLRLREGEADKEVSQFMERDPIILIVLQSKEASAFVDGMVCAAAEAARFKVKVCSVQSAKAGLSFMMNLPPGRRVCMIICDFEMHPFDGRWFLQQLKANVFFAPPCIFLTSNHLNSKLHKPEGSERIIHMLDLEQHDLMLMITRFCAPKRKKSRDKCKESADGKKKERIGNGGIAYKPSIPRKESIFAFTSTNRWKGSYSDVRPETVETFLKNTGGDAPRVIKLNSPRFRKSPPKQSWLDDCSTKKTVGSRILRTAGANATLKKSKLKYGHHLEGELESLIKTGRRGFPMTVGKGEEHFKLESNNTVKVDASIQLQLPIPKSPRPTIFDLASHSPRNKF